MGKLADFAEGKFCSYIIPRGQVGIKISQRHEHEQLERRIQEELKGGGKELLRVSISNVLGEKLTPIEYLTETGCVPELDWVKSMELKELTGEDAQRLLAAGCSKRKLLRLYGVDQVGGPHYKRLDKLLDELPADAQPADAQPDAQPAEAPNFDFAWLVPRKAGRLPRLTVNLRSGIRINGPAVELAPEECRRDCKVRVGIDAVSKAIAIRPIKKQTDVNALCFQLRNRALLSSSKLVGENLRLAGIKVPAAFDVVWDSELQAWVGTLGEEQD